MLVEGSRGKRVLEIGTAQGYSACAMGPEAISVLTIDPYQGYGSVADAYAPRTKIAKSVLGKKIITAIGTSREVLPQLQQLGVRFDFIFVDGDHRLAGILYDLEASWELLRARGTLAVHDVGEETCPDVGEAVKQFHVPGQVVVDTLWVATK